MAKTPDELSTEIADLKKSLLEKTEELTYRVPNPKEAEAEKTPFVDETAQKVSSALKKHLIGEPPQITTENFIREFFADALSKIKDIHIEVVKHKKTEMLEMLGLDKIAAVHEKYQEAKLDDKVAWWDWLTAGLLGIIPLIVIPALALFFKGKIIDWFRNRQAGGDENKPIWTSDGNGGLHKESLKSINAREARQFNGGTSLADIVQDETNAEKARNLTKELQPLNGELLKFNNRAPDFLRQFGSLPTPAKAKKAADVLQKISDAIGRINLTAFTTVANGIARIVDQTGKANPQHVIAVADAIGKLVLAAKDLKPEMIPKARPLQDAANAAKDLAQHTTTLTGNMRGFAQAVQALNREMNPGT
ncbi:hypothetical protein AB0B30_21585 [Streptomyces narbonensis]|uniref:Uncharacterized protein n=1 Tax=Streptomyces narbonensis TaxID=67333 RepID=A0ABV3C841_9ACTN